MATANINIEADCFPNSFSPNANTALVDLGNVGILVAGLVEVRYICIISAATIASTFPAGSTINTAQLAITVQTAALSSPPNIVSRYLVPGSVNDDATWNTKNGSNPWASAGANDPDFDYVPAATVTSVAMPTSTGAYVITGLAAQVQKALDDGTDLVLMLITSNTGADRYFALHSINNGTPANRPVLQTDYTEPAPPSDDDELAVLGCS